MTYPRSYQKALGVEPPDRVLWAALKAALPAEDVRQVEAAYKEAARRYNRASELNKIARWVRRIATSPEIGEVTRAKLERRQAILADPWAFVEGDRHAQEG